MNVWLTQQHNRQHNSPKLRKALVSCSQDDNSGTQHNTICCLSTYCGLGTQHNTPSHSAPLQTHMYKDCHQPHFINEKTRAHKHKEFVQRGQVGSASSLGLMVQHSWLCDAPLFCKAGSTLPCLPAWAAVRISFLPFTAMLSPILKLQKAHPASLQESAFYNISPAHSP